MNIGNLNLAIRVDDNSSCKNLTIIDESYYLDTPERPRLMITLPGYSSALTFDGFNASQINIYNSYSLGLSNSAATDCLIDIPDGLYQIVYMICPYDELYQPIYHIRQCKAWCDWNTAVMTMFDSCLDFNDDLKNRLERVEWLLKGATAFAQDCDPTKAIALHKKAVELITDIKCQLGI